MTPDRADECVEDSETGALYSVTHEKNKKFPGFGRNVSDYFSEFSRNTGIYGFKYMGDQKRSVIEKLFWLIIFCVSFYICISLIVQSWIKWDQSPVVVSFARSPTPVWQIPFPAITICSETKVKQRVYNFTDDYHKIIEELKTGEDILTAEQRQKFLDTSLICDNPRYDGGNKTTDAKIITHLMSIGPSFHEALFSCKWPGFNETCSDLFIPTLTEDGICFTFNMLDRKEMFSDAVYLHGDDMDSDKDSKDWTLENGYSKDAGKDTFPRRAISVGTKAGFIILLRAYKQDLDYVCRGPVQGFKVFLHHPAEFPRVGTHHFRAPLNQEILVAIKPEMMTTSPGLRNYEPHRRQCFFAKERRLQFFKIYTQQNCQIECVTNYTLAKCGCVAFHMPHENSTKICGSGSTVCMYEAEQELMAREVEFGISSYDSTHLVPTQCDCLPSCTSISYNAETSQADFNWPKVFESFKVDFNEFPGIQMTRLTIYFKEMQFVTSERNELYGQTDFLATCGGLFGLFTGFSFLTIVEIIYFLSLKLICNIKKYGIHFWSGSNVSLQNDALHKELLLLN